MWLTIAMLAWVPPQKGQEGPEAQRYAAIALSALDVAFDPAERPLFSGPHGRAQSPLQLLAIAGFESSYRRDVQLGEKRGKAGDSCLMQIVISGNRRMHLTDLTYEWHGPPKSGEESSGLTWRDLVGEDTHTCFRAGLHEVRESFQICHDLSMYTSGQCNHDIKAKHREQRAKMHYLRHPAPVTDADAMRSNKESIDPDELGTRNRDGI